MTEYEIRAAKLGAEQGKATASWTFDGGTSHESYVTFLQGYDDGDPEILDIYGPTSGWLSGEWADAMTVPSLLLAVDFDGETDPDGEITNAIAIAYENAAEQAYWAELERVAHVQLDDSHPGEADDVDMPWTVSKWTAGGWDVLAEFRTEADAEEFLGALARHAPEGDLGLRVDCDDPEA